MCLPDRLGEKRHGPTQISANQQVKLALATNYRWQTRWETKTIYNKHIHTQQLATYSNVFIIMQHCVGVYVRRPAAHTHILSHAHAHTHRPRHTSPQLAHLMHEEMKTAAHASGTAWRRRHDARFKSIKRDVYDIKTSWEEGGGERMMMMMRTCPGIHAHTHTLLARMHHADVHTLTRTHSRCQIMILWEGNKLIREKRDRKKRLGLAFKH